MPPRRTRRTPAPDAPHVVSSSDDEPAGLASDSSDDVIEPAGGPLLPSFDGEPCTVSSSDDEPGPSAARPFGCAGTAADDEPGPSAAPAPPTWTDAVLASLSDAQRGNLATRLEISYGDDCSGARSPLEALHQFLSALKEHDGINIRVRDVFASEAPGRPGEGPRAFIRERFAPEIIFTTVHRGSDAASGTNWCNDTLVPIPTTDVYHAGWVCRDVSNMNTRHRQPLLLGSDPSVAEGTAGASSLTLHSSLSHVRTHRPPIVLLENPVSQTSIMIAQDSIAALGGYSSAVFLVDSRVMGTPMSRRRGLKKNKNNKQDKQKKIIYI